MARMNRRDAESVKFGGRRASRRVALAVICLMLAAAGVPAGAQDDSRPLKPSDAVRTQVYVSLEPVPRGRQFEVAAVAQVAQGYHVQANKVLADYLIPLTLTPELPAGFRVVSTEYPKAQLKKFSFAAQPMAVYEGRIVVRMTLEAAAGAPTGSVKIPMTLRFQACNDQLCLPPAKLPLAVEFEVAGEGVAAKSIHPEIFRKQ
jgi:cytochrome c biogenesis DsbD-like protein